MLCFADVNVSQGSVATYARCGWTFDIHLTANLPRNLPLKNFLRSVKNRQNYGHESMATFFIIIIRLLRIKAAHNTLQYIKR